MGSRLLICSERCPPAMQQRSQWHIRDFALVKEIGSGAVSCVYYALCRKSCLRVAIKVYNKTKLTKLNARQVEREICIHSSLSHPHIVDFYAAFEDEQGIYMVLEYAEGGDLFDAVKRSGGRMPEAALVQQVLYPYLCSLLYLHSRGIIHRDIKPENTVFTREMVLKITDFGLAVNVMQERPVTRLGTLDYMAPEVLQCPDKYLPSDNKDRADLAYNEAVDAWAMGVLAYELIVGRPPFGMADRESTMRAITGMQPFIPEWMSGGAASFITMALEKSPATRAPIARLIQHPWIAMHTRTKDSLMQQQASTLQHAVQRLARPARGLNSGLSNSFTSSRLPQTSSADLSAGTGSISAAAAAAAVAVAQHQAQALGKPSPVLSSSGGFGSAGSSMTGSGWHAGVGGGMPGSPARAAIAAAAAAAAAVHQMDCSDLRPAKRLLQQRPGSHVSDAGGGALPCSLAQAPQHNNSKVQAYWRTLGPGWNGGSGAAGGDAALPSGDLQQMQPLSGMSPVSPLAMQGVNGSSQGHSPREQVPASEGRTMSRSSSKRRIQEVSNTDAAPDPSTGASGCLMQLLLDDGSVVNGPPAAALGSGAAAPTDGDSTAMWQQAGASGPASPVRPGDTSAAAGGPGQQGQGGSRVHSRSNSMHSPPSSPMMAHGAHQHQPSRFARAQRPTTPQGTADNFTSFNSGGSAAAGPGAAGSGGAEASPPGAAAAPGDPLGLGLGLGPGNLPALALRSHPLSSPYATPCSSPMHANSAQLPSSAQTVGDAQAPAARLSGIMDVAGLSLSSPGSGMTFHAAQTGDKRINGSSSGDSTGGPISPEVYRLMGGLAPDNTGPFAGVTGMAGAAAAQQQAQGQALGGGGHPLTLRQTLSAGATRLGGLGGPSPALQLGGGAGGLSRGSHLSLAGQQQQQQGMGGNAFGAAPGSAGVPQWQFSSLGQGSGAGGPTQGGGESLQHLRAPMLRTLSGSATRRHAQQQQLQQQQQQLVVAAMMQQQQQQQQQQQGSLERASSATSTFAHGLNLGVGPSSSYAGGQAPMGWPSQAFNQLQQQQHHHHREPNMLQRVSTERNSPVNMDLLLPFLDVDDSPLVHNACAAQQQQQQQQQQHYQGGSLAHGMQQQQQQWQQQLQQQEGDGSKCAGVTAVKQLLYSRDGGTLTAVDDFLSGAPLLSNGSLPYGLDMDVDELLAAVGGACSGSSSPIP